MFSNKYQHFKTIVQFCIDTLHDMAHIAKIDKQSTEEKLVNGCAYLLIRMMPYIVKDQNLCQQLLWSEESDMRHINFNASYAIKLIDSVMLLLFKPGYTIKEYKGEAKSMHGLDD